MKLIPQDQESIDQLYSIFPELKMEEVAVLKQCANAYVENSSLKGNGIDESLRFIATCIALKKHHDAPKVENIYYVYALEEKTIEKEGTNDEFLEEIGTLERLFLKSCDYNFEAFEKKFYTDSS